MRRGSAITAAALLLTAIGTAQLRAAYPVPAAPTVISGGPYILGQQPDGNSILFEDALGIVVIDTGRHLEQQDRIIRFARARGKPVTAIINTHWHLDHSGGNEEIRSAFPGAKLYASTAVFGALDGFLARNLADARKRLDDPALSPAERAAIALDVDAMVDRKDLLPDIPVTGTVPLRLGDRTLELHLAPHAATQGDVWVYDRATRTLAAGDLVVIPAPFFDTACPDGWRRALAAIAKMPFARVVPGHGEPLSRAQFATYRHAYDRLVDCSESVRSKDACIKGWERDAAALLPTDESRKTAGALLDYYFETLLRSPDRKREFCGA